LTSGSLFFTSGKTETFTGAILGWNFRKLRFSPPISSSAYAEQISARISRSTPNDGSMQCGTYFSFVCSSKYNKSLKSFQTMQKKKVREVQIDRQNTCDQQLGSRCNKRSTLPAVAVLQADSYSLADFSWLKTIGGVCNHRYIPVGRHRSLLHGRLAAVWVARVRVSKQKI
jgi:hypothetical protein